MILIESLHVPPTAVLSTYGSGTLGNASNSLTVLILTFRLRNILTILKIQI